MHDQAHTEVSRHTSNCRSLHACAQVLRCAGLPAYLLAMCSDAKLSCAEASAGPAAAELVWHCLSNNENADSINQIHPLAHGLLLLLLPLFSPERGIFVHQLRAQTLLEWVRLGHHDASEQPTADGKHCKGRSKDDHDRFSRQFHRTIPLQRCSDAVNSLQVMMQQSHPA